MGRVRCLLCVHKDELRPPMMVRRPISTRSVKSILWPAVIMLPSPSRKRGSTALTTSGSGIELISFSRMISA